MSEYTNNANENDGAFEIDVTNKLSGVFVDGKVRVLPENTLGQILQNYADDIGVEKSKAVIFENKRTNKETTDRTMTVSKFELRNGDVLSMNDDGSVA